MSQQTTQLFVHCHGIGEEAEQRIATLMDKVGLPATSTEGKSGEIKTQMTNGFENNEKNEDMVDDLFQMIEDEFEEMHVERNIGEGAGYQHLPFNWIYEFLIRDEDWVAAQKNGPKRNSNINFNWGKHSE